MLKKYITIIILLATLLPLGVLAQYTPDTTVKKEKVDMYRINNKVDLTLDIIGIAGTGVGFYLRETKADYDTAEVENLNINSLPKYDRKVVYNNSQTASDVSNILFAEGFVVPWLLYGDRKVRHEAYDYTVMYFETMGLTGAGYAMAAGLVKKFRPYAYNKDVSLGRRRNKHSANSFYAGHVAVTAAGTFFAARVYSDYHPDAAFRHVMWGLAGASTAAQCYARYRGGFHFVEDIALGAVLGTGAGVLVPVLHKRAQGSAISMEPYIGEVPGITLRYTFRDKPDVFSKKIGR